MLLVIAPPQNPLNGDSTVLLFALYGSVGGAIWSTWVWVKPATAIIETGGTQPFSATGAEVGAFPLPSIRLA